jgi:purine-nucleoside phosphorylase
MLHDLTRSDWQTLLNIPDDRIPAALIIRGTWALRYHYTQMRQLFSNVLDIRDPNVVIDDVFIGDIDGVRVAYASVYGAPMASEIVHVFGVLGTRLVIQIGCCGALSEHLLAGDLLAVSSAYGGEGASQYYKQDGKEISATVRFEDAVDPASAEGLKTHHGRVYTTSALFAESNDDIEKWGAQGFSGVDMETAATFAVAEYFGMQRAALLFVFDCPKHGEHILTGDQEKNYRRRLGNERMLQVVLATIRNRARA